MCYAIEFKKLDGLIVASTSYYVIMDKVVTKNGDSILSRDSSNHSNQTY
jgi:hypothetical protein